MPLRHFKNETLLVAADRTRLLDRDHRLRIRNVPLQQGVEVGRENLRDVDMRIGKAEDLRVGDLVEQLQLRGGLERRVGRQGRGLKRGVRGHQAFLSSARLGVPASASALPGWSEKVMNLRVNSEHTRSRIGDDTWREAASSRPKAGIGKSGAIQRTISKEGKYQIAESARRS